MLKQTRQKIEDISDELKALAPDIIIGGPPCQDFSIAGKLNLTGNRANLTRIYSHIIANVRPQWFVMENVYTIERSPMIDEYITLLFYLPIRFAPLSGIFRVTPEATDYKVQA